MIVFDLECRAGGHRFEGWFASSEDFAGQQARGLVTCPVCGAPEVDKALSAPRLSRKSNQLPASMPVPAAPPVDVPVASAPLPPEAVAMLKAVAAAQSEMLKASTWVGKNFAEDARAMHYGEKDPALIHGQASPAEVQGLIEEGVPVAPVLVPIVPPGEVN
ncbi:hypothetical protein AQZ52_10750 [Novosphingobium fuchskuhlense]|uniref:Uncharacterized protein n=1 Tax=Novosphingobium fuchskuhlense TaxID=1117702 RepID=A0A117UUL8_9SPHN|nr:DUF1178 family protein [Novosphingobium fuchskuhlense]KUR71143.1 hypothetical protein AQZ52_10750 [Novosphingobium fuchskuhlense]